MIDTVLHFGHTLVQLTHHGHMHHQTSEQSSISDLGCRERNRVPQHFLVLPQDQEEKADLEDPRDNDFQNEGLSVFLVDHFELNDVVQVIHHYRLLLLTYVDLN